MGKIGALKKNGYNFDLNGEKTTTKKFSGAPKILVLHVRLSKSIEAIRAFTWAQPLVTFSRNLLLLSFSRDWKRASGFNRVSLDAVFSSCAKIQLGMHTL